MNIHQITPGLDDDFPQPTKPTTKNALDYSIFLEAQYNKPEEITLEMAKIFLENSEKIKNDFKGFKKNNTQKSKTYNYIICNQHKKNFFAFCKTHSANICEDCNKENHKNCLKIYYKNIIYSKKNIDNIQKKLLLTVEKICKIKEILSKLVDVFGNMNKFLSLQNNKFKSFLTIFNFYNEIKYNYDLIKAVNVIIDNKLYEQDKKIHTKISSFFHEISSHKKKIDAILLDENCKLKQSSFNFTIKNAENLLQNLYTENTQNESINYTLHSISSQSSLHPEQNTDSNTNKIYNYTETLNKFFEIRTELTKAIMNSKEHFTILNEIDPYKISINSEKHQQISIELSITNADINEKILLINNAEIFQSQTKMFINQIEWPLNRYYKFAQLGTYKIDFIFYEKISTLKKLFYNCRKIKKITFNNVDVKNCRNMNSMCKNCEELLEINFVGSFNTKKVKQMKYVFQNCRKLASIDLSKFITKNVINLNEFFSGCESLAYVNLSNFAADKCLKIYGMFNGCVNLKEINMQNFNCSNLKNVSYCFNNCCNLTKINMLQCVFHNVVEKLHVFDKCFKLEKIVVADLNGFKNAFRDVAFKDGLAITDRE